MLRHKVFHVEYFVFEYYYLVFVWVLLIIFHYIFLRLEYFQFCLCTDNWVSHLIETKENQILFTIGNFEF